jgi:putative peptide zinc metalloprotease protein
MTTSLFSPSWHRVASLTPRLRSHARIYRHYYRGDLWYVLQDPASQRSHRLTPAANLIIGLMDGKRTVQELWEIAAECLGDDAPTQDEMIRLLSQLHGADALQCDVAPDTSELLQRYQRQKRGTLARKVMNPMALRIPLFDPDRFLAATVPLVRPLFGWVGALVWIAVVGTGAFLAGAHWPDLTQNLTDRVLAPKNLLLLGLVFPIVKAFHEFGHAYATKVWGGEVHEMGIMFLVLMPIPYVDASAASAFREKRKRAIVGSGGMIVELFIAALALFVWLNIEPGVVRSLAYNVILIASVSTLLFNANPLLRFDGYYIFSDLIEIQNLGTRSTRYLGYLCQRYLFGLRELEVSPSTAGERRWFVGYGIAAFVYRMFVVAAIVLFVAGKFFFIGVLLAIWGVTVMVVAPLVRNVAKIFTSPAIRPKRTRAVVTTGALAAAIVATVTLVPVPSWTRAEGVVWVPGDMVVRARTAGFVERLLVPPGAAVRRGDLLIACRDRALTAKIKQLRGRLAELEARHRAEVQKDIVKAEIIREEMDVVSADLQQAERDASDLTIRSEADGVFVVPNAEDLPGQYVKKGQVLGYTLDLSTVTAKVVISQHDIDLVRQHTTGVEVRMADHVAEVVPATVRHEVPAATDQLPSLILAQQGGGQIAIDPRERQRTKAFQKLFVLDIDFPAGANRVNVNGRVYVRFDHGREPLLRQWYRGLRQLFLTRFNV